MDPDPGGSGIINFGSGSDYEVPIFKDKIAMKSAELLLGTTYCYCQFYCKVKKIHRIGRYRT